MSPPVEDQGRSDGTAPLLRGAKPPGPDGTSPKGGAVQGWSGSTAGGMVIGAPQQDDRFCTETAGALGITIASVDYRLAPEHPHPIPLALAHRLHDRGGMQPAAQWLLYPMLDDRTAAETSLDSVDHVVWNNVSNRMGWDALLRGVAATGTREVPASAAPARREDLTGLPPAWIGVGDIDLFHAEDAQYASRLALAGVPVQFDTLPGAPHGFGNLALESALVQAFMVRARTWLEHRLASQES